MKVRKDSNFEKQNRTNGTLKVRKWTNFNNVKCQLPLNVLACEIKGEKYILLH